MAAVVGQGEPWAGVAFLVQERVAAEFRCLGLQLEHHRFVFGTLVLDLVLEGVELRTQSFYGLF